MKIEIIAGVFGLKEGVHVRAVRPGDDPIEVDDEIAQRLIKGGVAKEIKGEDVEVAKSAEAIEDEGEQFPEYSEKMTRAQLEEIAEQVGVDADLMKAAETKAQLIELIDEVKAEQEAPTFDPEGDML